MFRFTRRHARPAGVEPVWAACSALLDYPTEELIARLDHIRAVVPDNEHLAGLLDHLASTDLGSLQAQYVETFDHTRKCALYLTYFAYGDTRRRGVALVQFKQAYRKAGVLFEPGSDDELPDHLSVVLQFGATVDADAAWRLLNSHRAGIEMLRIALTDWDDGAGSPWLGAVAALSATLPELRGEEAEAVRRLIAEGPPDEQVGLQPYGVDPMTSAPEVIAPAQIPVGVDR